MKKILLLLHILPLIAFSQNRFLAKLPVRGGVSEIGVSPSEKIWIATSSGNTFFTQKIGELWHIGPYGSFDPYHLSSGMTFERVNFFDEDTLMISGFLQEGGKQNFIFRSTDKGLTWNKVKFGRSSWIDAFYHNDSGKAWMSGSSQLIYYTDDKGETWKNLGKAGKEKRLRFSTIHFANDEKTGLFGSYWNVLYKTIDNCETWERLPTPLDQEKYKRLSKKHRPDLRKIRIFEDYYLINQQGKVFYTKNDHIDWIELPTIIDFEVSSDASVFFIDKNLNIDLRDSNFVSVWKSTKSLKGRPVTIATQNKSLFVFTYDEIYKINPNEFIVSELLTNEISIQEPYIKLNYNGEEIGMEDQTVLKYDADLQQWYRFMKLPFDVSSATLYDNEIIVTDYSLESRWSLDLETKIAKEYELPKSLFDLSVNNIVEFSIEVGSQGCFHQQKQQKTYSLQDHSFHLQQGDKEFLPTMNQKIKPELLNEIVTAINTSRFQKLSVSDLEVSDNDLANFKKFIDKEQKKMRKKGYDIFDYHSYYNFPGENTDFNFYKNWADKFDSIPDFMLNHAFNEVYVNRSTTTYWRRISIEFANGDLLTIQNTDNMPNYLYTPWLINYNGLVLKSNSLKLGRLIDELTAGELYDDIPKDKNYAIFKVINFLYKNSWNN